IYKLDGDSLTLCVRSRGGRNKDGMPINPHESIRPMAFSSADGNMLLVLTRNAETPEQKLTRLAQEVEKLQKIKADYLCGAARSGLGGTTILMYEIDMSRFPDGKPPEDWDLGKLAGHLKKRIDPRDLHSITVRPVGKARLEVIIPMPRKPTD